MSLWQANPHEYGEGKLHIVDSEDPKRTYCGKFLEACPGSPRTSGRATCKSCLNAFESRKINKVQREIYQREYEERQRQEAQQKDEERREWFEWYDHYLQSPEWREKSRAVIRRANGTCEGCGKRSATQAHHLTYAHVGDEFLWELRAVCTECHERAHADKEHR